MVRMIASSRVFFSVHDMDLVWVVLAGNRVLRAGVDVEFLGDKRVIASGDLHSSKRTRVRLLRLNVHAVVDNTKVQIVPRARSRFEGVTIEVTVACLASKIRNDNRRLPKSCGLPDASTFIMNQVGPVAGTNRSKAINGSFVVREDASISLGLYSEQQASCSRVTD